MLLSTVGLLLQLLATASPDVNTLRMARGAQQRFESLRRARLPVEWTGGSSGRCDARIGRYCYWYDSAETPPVAEPRAIAEARARLLAVLDSAATRSPADGWIAGQRVRYLIEAGRAEDAIAAARACAAEGWWCAALEGLALHIARRDSASDAVFSTSLAAMPDARRCAWEDVRVLLDGRLKHELSRADCRGRARLAQRLLVLGQPLWSMPGNDLRAEILSRRTMVMLLARTANAQGMSWGDDSEELLLRYGWSEWFTRQESSALYYASPVITGHDREPSYNVMPDIRAVAALPRLTEDSWRLRSSTALSRYSPRSIASLTGLQHQLVRFPRGDSLLIATVFAVTDTAMQRDTVAAALAAFDGDDMRIARTNRHVVTLVVPNDTTIVSVEAFGSPSRHAARARYTIDPLPNVHGAMLSDLLLYDPRSAIGDSIDNVLVAARPSTRISADEPLGVLWETAGLSSGAAWIGVSVEPAHVGLGRRLATRLHLAPEPGPVRLRWQAVLDSAQTQHVTIRLPEKARGRYRVVLTVQTPGAAPLTTAREIEIVP